MPRQKTKFKILTAGAVISVLSIFMFQSSPEKKNGNYTSLVSEPLILDNQQIEFSHTDDNEDETLIIKTDKKHYAGQSWADIYISITNTTNTPQKSAILFYFLKDKNKDNMVTIEQRKNNEWRYLTFFKDNIKIDSSALSAAIKKRETIPNTFEIRSGTQLDIPANGTTYLLARLEYTPNTGGEFWVEALGDDGAYGLLDPVYGTSASSDTKPGWFGKSGTVWTNRKRITIDHFDVVGSSSFGDFPVLINLVDNDLKHTNNAGKVASASGGDIVFTSSGGTTQLDHEIEGYDPATGELIAWVRVPTLSTTADTVLYIYYGGSATGQGQQNPTGVWDGNFQQVYHLDQDPSVTTDGDCAGSTFEVCDSTSNNRDGDMNGAMTTSDKVQGVVSKSLDFDGSNDYIDTNYGPNLAGNSFTVSMWFKTPTKVAGGFIMFGSTADTGTQDESMSIGFSSASCTVGQLLFSVRDTDSTSNDTLCASRVDDSAWYHVAVVHNPSGNNTMYLNGTIHQSAAVTANSSGSKDFTSYDFFLGGNNGRGTAGDFISAVVDELHFSTGMRSSDWIETEYNNQKSPKTFYSVGGQESFSQSGGPGLKIRGGVQFR
ncbi:MAG: MshQ-like protein [Parcubacteria group bacterium Gr01-1014_2]|nr:MAG: MshQ-like protein [Parcubacteria group bacterium Gr01-1014_2]